MSDKNMAKVAAVLLNRLPARNQGWLLDAWPKNLAQAQELFSSEVQMSPAEIQAQQDRKDKETERLAKAGGAKGAAPAKEAPKVGLFPAEIRRLGYRSPGFCRAMCMYTYACCSAFKWVFSRLLAVLMECAWP